MNKWSIAIALALLSLLAFVGYKVIQHRQQAESAS
jgi:hypothetical protein